MSLYNHGMVGEWLRPLICPLCDAPLIEGEQALQCANRHSFDLSGDGYINLLLRRRKLPDTVGDSPEMLKARREFLGRGFYDPLSARLNALVAGLVAGQPQPVIVDAGCGEGFYLRRLGETLASSDAALFGVDVARRAVRMAARADGHGRYVVADVNVKLPFAGQSVHVLLNIFAPRRPAQFARIVAHSGWLLVVAPAPAHLYSLRQRFGLLHIQAGKQRHILNQFAADFCHVQTEVLSYEMRLDNPALSALVQMTPNARHLTPSQWAQIHHTPYLVTEACFELLQFTTRDPC